MNKNISMINTLLQIDNNCLFRYQAIFSWNALIFAEQNMFVLNKSQQMIVCSIKPYAEHYCNLYLKTRFFYNFIMN